MGHRVSVAKHGQEALEILETKSFDVIFMDMQMPVMDGLEATRRYRTRETELGRARTPIIAMTANAMASDRETCLAAGMDDHIAKPIKVKTLQGCLLALGTTLAPSAGADNTEGSAPIPLPRIDLGFDYATAVKQADAEIIEIIAQVFSTPPRVTCNASAMRSIRGKLMRLCEWLTPSRGHSPPSMPILPFNWLLKSSLDAKRAICLSS